VAHGLRRAREIARTPPRSLRVAKRGIERAHRREHVKQFFHRGEFTLVVKVLSFQGADLSFQGVGRDLSFQGADLTSQCGGSDLASAMHNIPNVQPSSHWRGRNATLPKRRSEVPAAARPMSGGGRRFAYVSLSLSLSLSLCVCVCVCVVYAGSALTAKQHKPNPQHLFTQHVVKTTIQIFGS
jgi:hypothetical protein